MSGTPDGGATDFNARLQAAMDSAKRKSGGPAAPAAPPSESTAPDDAFQQRLGAALSQARGEPEPSADAESTAVSGGPVGQGNHVVRDGDSVASIAYESGHFWETIWNDPANQELKQARKTPNVLLEGDQLTVPELRRKDESLAPELRHRFRRRGEPSFLHLKVEFAGEPVAGEPYTLEIDGKACPGGTTGAEGDVQIPVPGNSQRATLVVGEGAARLAYELYIGHTSPVTEIVGVQHRLLNLGFGCDCTGEMDAATIEAIKQFQRDQGLTETGQPDDATRASLEEKHGS